MRFVLSFIKVLKMSKLFREDQDQGQDFFFKTKTKTFVSRPRPRPFFMSSRRLETKTKVSRLHLWHVFEVFCTTDRKSVPSHYTPSQFTASVHQHYQSSLGIDAVLYHLTNTVFSRIKVWTIQCPER